MYAHCVCVLHKEEVKVRPASATTKNPPSSFQAKWAKKKLLLFIGTVCAVD